MSRPAEPVAGRATLTADMKRVIVEQRLAFVASVNADGTPNLSPKGTTVVVDDEHIGFGAIRSPATVANLRDRPAVELNLVDPTARKGYRFRGRAEVIERGHPDFAALSPLFERWGALSERIQAIVRIRVERALPLSSPAYDSGATEAELRRGWLEHFQAIQPRSDE